MEDVIQEKKTIKLRLWLLWRLIVNEISIIKIRIKGAIDKLTRNIAWVLPKRLVMWCCFRVAANATSGEWGNVNPSELKFFDMMDRWHINNV